jgi:hypothetical protein
MVGQPTSNVACYSLKFTHISMQTLKWTNDCLLSFYQNYRSVHSTWDLGSQQIQPGPEEWPGKVPIWTRAGGVAIRGSAKRKGEVQAIFKDIHFIIIFK